MEKIVLARIFRSISPLREHHSMNTEDVYTPQWWAPGAPESAQRNSATDHNPLVNFCKNI